MTTVTSMTTPTMVKLTVVAEAVKVEAVAVDVEMTGAIAPGNEHKILERPRTS